MSSFMMKALGYAGARLTEPSSYAGLGALLAMFGMSDIPAPVLGQMAQVLAGACGVLAFFMRDRG